MTRPQTKTRLVAAMTARKRLAVTCLKESASDYGNASFPDAGTATDDDFAVKLSSVLKDQRAIASLEEQGRLIDHLFRALRQRKAVAHLWSKNRKSDDIIGLIQVARDAGDLDEAIWRCFLAAHFGRASADADQVHSASDLLCAFRAEPYWTWQRVSDAPDFFRNWLADHAADLHSLAYGNHRKYESKWPGDIWAVVESFLTLAQESGGPAKLMTSDEGDGAAQFDVLYRSLSGLRRFGRTGRFDFLALMFDLRLISADPASCYLRGATGPLKGAKRLWGKRPIGQLEQLAADLAEQLGISPMAVEDALCNWQKGGSGPA